MEVFTQLQKLLVLFQVEFILSEVVELVFLFHILLQLLQRVFPAFENEKVVPNHDIKISQDYCDRLHDIPGQMEVDQVVDQSILSKHEWREQPSHIQWFFWYNLVYHFNLVVELTVATVQYSQELFKPYLLNLVRQSII